MRNEVKEAIQNVLSNVPGVASIYGYRPNPKYITQFPTVIISIPKADEERLSASAPIGMKKVEFSAQIEIFAYDNSADGSGQQTFETLLDDIDAALRANPTLNGSVLSAGIDYLRTQVAAPQMVNQSIALLAMKQFDVTVQISG
jgi:hypothetical protein